LGNVVVGTFSVKLHPPIFPPKLKARIVFYPFRDFRICLLMGGKTKNSLNFYEVNRDFFFAIALKTILFYCKI